MAKVKKIIPCVCIDHEPDVMDSVHYGMPQLKVSSGNGKQFWTPFCPVCGRGGCSEYKSSYYALKAWNEMQERLWQEKDPKYPELFGDTE